MSPRVQLMMMMMMSLSGAVLLGGCATRPTTGGYQVVVSHKTGTTWLGMTVLPSATSDEIYVGDTEGRPQVEVVLKPTLARWLKAKAETLPPASRGVVLYTPEGKRWLVLHLRNERIELELYGTDPAFPRLHLEVDETGETDRVSLRKDEEVLYATPD